MNRRVVRRITLWLILGFVILGCVTPAAVTPLPDSESVSVETIIVQTAEAAQTQTAILAPDTATPTLIPLPTKTLTITPTPTATVLFLLFPPTNTSVPTGLFAGDNNSGGGSGSGSNDNNGDGFDKPTKTPPEWACSILSRYPAAEVEVPGGSKIKTTWTVRNTGTKTWPKKGVDVVFVSGTRLNDGRPYYDIPAGVGPGGTVKISVTMNIPKASGSTATRWALRVGNTDFCSIRFAFVVK
jgi:hypothetical protein